MNVKVEMLTYLDFLCKEAKRMQRSSKHTVETKKCLGMRGCRGLGAKVATQVPVPLLFKN